MSSLRLFSAPVLRAATMRSTPVTMSIRAYASSKPSGKSTASKGTDTEDVQHHTRGKPGSAEALGQSDFAQESDGRHFGKERSEGESKSHAKAQHHAATQQDKNTNQTLNKGTSQEYSGQRDMGSAHTPSQMKQSIDQGNANAARETYDSFKETVKDTAKAAIRSVQPLFTDKVGEGHGTKKASAEDPSPVQKAAEALTGAIKEQASAIKDKATAAASSASAAASSAANKASSAAASAANKASSAAASAAGMASSSSDVKSAGSTSTDSPTNPQSTAGVPNLHAKIVEDFKHTAEHQTESTPAHSEADKQQNSTPAAGVVDSAKSTVEAVVGTVTSAVNNVADSGVVEAAKHVVESVVETAKHAGETVVTATTTVLETTGLKEHVETASDKAKYSAAEAAKNMQERANELFGTGFGKSAAATARADHIHGEANKMAEEKSEATHMSHQAGDIARAAAHDAIKETNPPRHKKRST